jgi:hypothetical protein
LFLSGLDYRAIASIPGRHVRSAWELGILAISPAWKGMGMWISLVVLLALGQAEPGPLDAFRANYSGVKVDVDYSYGSGFVDASVVSSRRLLTDRDFEFAESPETRIEGRWGCDGSAEYFGFGSPSDIVAAGKRRLAPALGKSRLYYTPWVEAIYDGETLVAPSSTVRDFADTWIFNRLS